jgi:hypothetical protein
MKKSGLADSPLFKVTQQNDNTLIRSPKLSIRKKNDADKDPPTNKTEFQPNNRDTTIPRNHETMKPRNHEPTVSRYHDTMVSRHYETTVEAIRKAVKEFGKEAATYRFTPEEKEAITDIVYAYKQRGIKTSENEITRIGVNFILQDHRENNKKSILDLVIKALNQ